MKYRLTKYFLMLMIFISCSESKDMVFEKFKLELENQGLKIEKVDDDGLIHVSHTEINFQVSLDNLERDYARDNDESRIVEFVATIKNQLVETPSWTEVADKAFIDICPYDTDFTDLVFEGVSDKFSKVFALHLDGQIRWITLQQLTDWNISKEHLQEQVDGNLIDLLNRSTIEIEDVDGHKLGLIACPKSTLKAALVFSKNLREKVEDEFGWPIYAVIPVRDFCYIFSKSDFDYFSKRLGEIVVEEYTKSGYPVTTELLEVSDLGIKAIGEYPHDLLTRE